MCLFQALATAVWSVLRAKRRMLKFPKGFMAHFYSISEKISPLMAWGFLGPDESLKETCLYFKVNILQNYETHVILINASENACVLPVLSLF